jgi:hypothetical protein
MREDGNMQCHEFSIVGVLTSATKLAGHGMGGGGGGKKIELYPKTYPEHIRGPANMTELRADGN